MTLREMTRADVAAGLRLCRLSHWNQVGRDWEQFLSLTPGGATVAVDDGGEVIGSVATMRYLAVPDTRDPLPDDPPVPDTRDPLPADPPVPVTRDPAPGSVAWIAMVLVDPAHRGAGIGTCLLERGLAQAADVPTVGLDATPLGQPLYEKLGFRPSRTFTRMHRNPSRGRTTGPDDASPDAWPQQVRPATSADLDGIAALDARITGLDRRAMLDWLHVGGPELAWVCDGADGVEGALLGRHGHLASHVGPLLATSGAMAEALLRAALAQHERAVFLDVSDDRPGWRQRVEALGFCAQRPFTRMYRGAAPPEGDPTHLFAIIGPEFG